MTDAAYMEYQVYQSIHLVYTALSVWFMNKPPTLAANSSFHGSQNQEIEDVQSMRIQNTNNYLYWDDTSLLTTRLLSDAKIMYKPGRTLSTNVDKSLSHWKEQKSTLKSIRNQILNFYQKYFSFKHKYYLYNLFMFVKAWYIFIC